MPITKTFNNTSYSIPLEGELNWATLSDFLVALADYGQTINKQKVGIRVATSSPVTVLTTTDCVIVTDLSVAGAVAVNLPAGATGQVYTIVDGKGDAGTNNITITPAAGTINGAATYVIDSNRAGVSIIYNGTSWTVIAEFISSGDIPRNQIAAGTANHVVINDGSGDLSSEATLAQTRGGMATDASVLSDGYVKKASGNFTTGAIAAGDLPSNIDATKIANGTVDNTEFQYLGGVTSDIQTQINAKAAGAASSTNNAIARFDLATGKVLKNSSVTVDDTGTVAGVNDITPTTINSVAMANYLTTSNTKAVTNKDIDGGTAANTSRITVPKDTKANLDALTRKQGTVVYGTDTQTLYSDDGVRLNEVGSEGSSFKLVDVTDPNATIKGGYLLLDDGREIATYDGSGTASTDFGTDIVVNLDTVLGGNPANATTYYLYLDLLNLGSEVTIDNGRKVYSVAAADTTKFYLSTTKPEAINRARYAVIGFIRSATTGTVWSGSGAAFGTIASKKHDNGPVAVNPVVYTLPKQAVGSIGSSGQIVAGHVLDINSFPTGSSSSNTAICNLVNGSGTNALGNSAADLTPTGTPTGATSILGVASAATALNGSTQYFSSTNAWYDPGNTDFTYGIWAKLTDWTPTTTNAIISAGGAGDVSVEILVIATTGVVRFYYPIDASNQGSIDISNSFVDGSWHHIAVKYKASTTTFSFYVDGALVGSVVQANRNMVTDKFNIGANTSAGQKLTGSIDEFFYTSSTLSDEEIRKLYAAKINHAANVATAYQEWNANIYSKVATQDDQSWLVDKTDKDNLFVDFSGLGATDSVELMLKNTGLTPVIVSPVPPFDQTYSSAPTFPITHGQPVIPSVEIMQEVSSGVWETISPEGYVQANSTQLIGSVAALFTGGATKVRIIAKSPQNDATGVIEASSTKSGIVTSGNQTIGGVKTYPNTPTCSYSLSADQTGKTSGSAYKVPFNTLDFSIGSLYDNAVNYRIQPTVGGKYLINFSINIASGTADSLVDAAVQLYKNGTAYRSFGRLGKTAAAVLHRTLISGSIVVDANGTSDYFELFAFANTASGTWTIEGGNFASAPVTHFSCIKNS